MLMSIECERETDGHWIAEVPEIPGAIAYGETIEEATSKIKALALRVIADREENNSTVVRLS